MFALSHLRSLSAMIIEVNSNQCHQIPLKILLRHASSFWKLEIVYQEVGLFDLEIKDIILHLQITFFRV